MCGITGILHGHGKPVSSRALHAMTESIAHRGPDGKGHFVDGAIGLGHRRLAILDLSNAGSQPMTTEDGRFTITYNGEVYNFKELRSDLQQRGHGFVSQTDSEVVLKSFVEWGDACLQRFNGMFAFAIWDSKREALFVARDRYGVKPLYWSQSNHSFCFGSEVKAILSHPEFGTTLDKEALLEYFTFQNLFTDRTLFKGIRLLPPGCFMNVSGKDDVTSTTTRYWDYAFVEPEAICDEREYEEELDRLLQQAVRRQLVSDVDVGAYLSGGMDSGTITALASRQVPFMKTFTCGFDLRSASGIELSFDEREKAEYMSYCFKTEHYEMVLKSGDMERVMPKLAWHLEEPRVGQSYPNYYAAGLASKFVKVVLSGAGGDELFAGYPWRYYPFAVNRNFDTYVENYYKYWQRLVDNTVLARLFSPIHGEVKHVWTQDIFHEALRLSGPVPSNSQEFVNASLGLEARTFLHGLLVVEDKLSMAHGVETRVPFLDNDLVDFAMQVPVRSKLANLGKQPRIDENEPGDKQGKYFSSTRDGKLILRKVMSRHIPKDVSNGAKRGFSAPDGSWFKGESIEYVQRRILGDESRIYEFLDAPTVRKLVNEHLDGAQNRRLLIWSLLSFELWLQTYMNN